MSHADWAQKVYGEAATEYFAATADYEAAHICGAGIPDSDAERRFRAAAAEYVAALHALTRARKEQVPSFESLLSDPTVQVDPEGLVLDSIRAYAAAEPASAGSPMRRSRTYDDRPPASRVRAWARARHGDSETADTGAPGRYAAAG